MRTKISQVAAVVDAMERGNTLPQNLRGIEGSYNAISKAPSSGKWGDSYIADSGKNETVFVKITKVSRDQHSNFDAIQAFLGESFAATAAEFSALKRLHRQRPDLNIPMLLDVGLHKLIVNDDEFAVPFVVYEYVQGISLATTDPDQRDVLFRQVRHPEAFGIRTFELIQTLNEMHQQRVLHGDIHPGNLIYDSGKESLILVDFGQAFVLDHFLARNFHDKDPDNVFTAPERLTRPGSPARWHEQADVYSLGATIFAMCILEAPSKALRAEGKDRTALIDKTLAKKAPDLLAAYPGLPQIIAKCTDPDLTVRYKNAHDLLKDWKQIVLNQNYKLPEAPQIKEMISHREDLVAQGPIFHALFGEEFERLHELTTGLVKGRSFRVVGSREQILRRLITIVESLEAGDVIFEQSFNDLWKRNNLGSNGRYQAVLRKAVGRGVRLVRMFYWWKSEEATDHWDRLKTAILEIPSKDAQPNLCFAKRDSGVPEIEKIFTTRVPHLSFFYRSNGQAHVLMAAFDFEDHAYLRSAAQRQHEIAKRQPPDLQMVALNLKLSQDIPGVLSDLERAIGEMSNNIGIRDLSTEFEKTATSILTEIRSWPRKASDGATNHVTK